MTHIIAIGFFFNLKNIKIMKFIFIALLNLIKQFDLKTYISTRFFI